jgi:hypothetical protein
MDGILALYTEQQKEGHEVHCFDETTKQLLDTPRGGTRCAKGKARRLDYEYRRNGTRNLFVAVAPFAGTRTVSVTERRTALDTALFLWTYCMETHRHVCHIHLVLDNLNTHTEASLRRILGEEKAEQFFSRVTLHFTPKHASWLNMAELEINCLKTQGLKHRVATDTLLRSTVQGIVAERNYRTATLSWRFNKTKAREKFPALYTDETELG